MSAAEIIFKGRACGSPRCDCARGRRTHCPAHQDRKPSMAVDERNGRVLVRCWAGCSQTSVVEGLKQCGLWPSSGRARTRQPESPLDEARRRTLDGARRFMLPEVLFRYHVNDWLRQQERAVAGLRQLAMSHGECEPCWTVLERAAQREMLLHFVEAEDAELAGLLHGGRR